MTLSWIVPQMTSIRAGLQAKRTDEPPLHSLPESASPAPLEGVSEQPGPASETPSCSFCHDKADVVYVHGADLTLAYCGLHALEILDNFPALWYAADWHAA